MRSKSSTRCAPWRPEVDDDAAILRPQNLLERSPVELFLFQDPATATGTGFTNNATNITVGAQTYEAVGISRDEASYDRESNSGEIRISMSAQQEFARKWIIIAPADKFLVTIFRRHVTDDLSPQLEIVTWWKGFISQVVFEGSTAIISCKPLIELMSRQGPRMTFQQPCNHVLYDDRCTVSENSFRFQAIPAAISSDGTQFTFTGIGSSPPLTSAPSGFQGNFYIGGMIRDFLGVDHRLIVGQSGDVITVQYAFEESLAGQQLDVFAGCDHQIGTCAQKFSNEINHGGHPYLPDRNVFEKGLDSTDTQQTNNPLTEADLKLFLKAATRF